MDIPFSLILDIFVAVLLVVTISYAVILNKRLGSLRGDREELQKLALSFGEATGRAEESIAELRSTTELLQERIKRAEALREDLVFLMERGNTAADRLESLVRTARDDVGAAPQSFGPSPKPAPTDSAGKVAAEGVKNGGAAKRSAPKAELDQRPAPDAQSDAERELLRALRSAG